MIIELELFLDQSRRINHFNAGRSFGEGQDARRVELAMFLWNALIRLPGRATLTQGDGISHWDWVDPWVRLEDLGSDRASFNRLWYYEVDQAAVARNWVRRAVRWVDTTINSLLRFPVDERHSAYLVDRDAFVTADLNFAHAVQSIRRGSPVPLAKIVAIDVRHPSITAQIDRALADD